MGNGEGNTIGDVCKGKIKPKSGIPERDFPVTSIDLCGKMYILLLLLFLSA